MKHLFTLLFFACTLFAYSQAHKRNTVSFNLNFDGAAHGTVAEYYYNNTLVDQDTSAAATTMFRFDAHYNIIERLSVGIFYRKGKYIEDPDNAEAAGNKVSDFNFGLRGYMVNKDKFSMYAGIYYGFSNLEINRIYSGIPANYQWKGTNFSADLGFNWYFAKVAGLNFSLGYSGHAFDLQEYSINGAQQSLANSKHTFDTKGVHVNLGVVFHILGD